MSSPLPENWFEVSPIRYEYRSGPLTTDLHGNPKPGTVYLTVVTVERNKDEIEVSIDSFTGGYGDGAAFTGAEIPLEIIHRLVAIGEKS